jgi:hypothetical protein
MMRKITDYSGQSAFPLMMQTVSITESPIITNGIVIANGPFTFGVILILNGADFFPASKRPP